MNHRLCGAIGYETATRLQTIVETFNVNTNMWSGPLFPPPLSQNACIDFQRLQDSVRNKTLVGVFTVCLRSSQ